MRTLGVCLLLCCVLTTETAARAAEPVGAPEVAMSVRDFKASYSQGRGAARSIAKITGVSMTPLLGMAILGARTYFSTPKDQRSKLPWHQQPAFFVTGILVMLVLWLGHRLPIIKKLFKLMKLYESKVSAAVALPVLGKGLALVAAKPIAIGLTSAAALVLPSAYAAGANSPGVVSDAALHAGQAVAWLAGILIGAIVWMAGHTVNVLVLISPVGLVDWILKSMKAALIGFLLFCAAANPWLGLVVSLVYILAALWIAGWSFRLMVFGFVFSSDVLLFRSGRQTIVAGRIEAFVAGLEGVAARTFGYVTSGAEGLEFVYRPWLVFKRRSVRLPAKAELAIEKGLISPVLLRVGAGEKPSTLVRFPPRYRPHGAAIAVALGPLQLRDAPVVRGFQAAKAWIKEQVGRRRAPLPVGPPVETASVG